MNTDAVILGICTITTVLLGILILLRNARLRAHRIFAFFSFSIAFWGTCNYLADNISADQTAFFTRLTFVAGVFIVYSGLLLSQYFPNEKLFEKQQSGKYYLLAASLIAVLSMTPLVIENSTKGPNGAILEVGPLYFVFVVYLLFSLSIFVRNFVRQYKSTHLVIQRAQIKLILLGIMLYALFTVLFNLIIPLFVDNWSSSRYGPIFSVLTVALTAYTIIKHKLFDIRIIIVRSVAYLGSLLVFAALYGFLVLGLIVWVFDVELTFERQALFALAASVAALAFPYVKESLDKLTSRVFYRDAYDSQHFLNKFNQQLVSTLDIEKLIDRTSNLITHTLKSEYCVIALGREGSRQGRIIGTGVHKLSPTDLSFVHAHKMSTEQGRMHVVVADHLTYESENLQQAMLKKNIAVLAHLGSHGQKGAEVGHMALGPKKTGNPYTSQDILIIETIANELVIAIQNALRFEEIERFKDTLQQKIDDATGRLREANERLKVLDRNKDDFVSMASHQLRTPLTSVKGYLSMVLEGDAGKITAMQRKMIEQAFASSERMTYLISDLLNLSRLKTGKFVISASSVSLVELVHQEIAQLHRMAQASGVDMVIDMPDEMPRLQLDETKTRQLIMNLVDNAIYYTPKGGKVTVQLKQTPKTIELRIIDTGIGVPKDEQHKLFTRFYRATNAKRRRPDGTGIGLYMVKKAVIAMGGAVIFDSAEGKGSTFGFTFPIKNTK